MAPLLRDLVVKNYEMLSMAFAYDRQRKKLP